MDLQSRDCKPVSSGNARPATTSVRIPHSRPTSAESNRTLPGRLDLPECTRHPLLPEPETGVGYSPRQRTSSRSAGPIRPWSSSPGGEASGVCDLPSHGLSAQDGRGLRNPGTVQAVQHVIDGARRSLPGVGHRLDGFVHADRVQMELVDKEVVGMSGLDVPIAQDFSGKVVQARDQSGPGSRRSAGIQYPSAVMIIGSTWHGAATTPET